MLDVLFDNQVCSLVYMTDLTQIIAESKKSLDQEKLLQASEISEQLQMPQEAIILLLDQLSKTCTDDQKRILEGVYMGTRHMKLLIMNFINFQELKSNMFNSNEKICVFKEAVISVINNHKINAS